MPWVIRNEFDRFNHPDAAPKDDQDSVETGPNQTETGTSPKLTETGTLLPDQEFMNRVRQHQQQQQQQHRQQSSPFLLNQLSRLLSHLPFPHRPRQPVQLPNSPSRASPSQFLDFGRKVAIVGLHGWFPNRLLHHVIGDPRLTSDRIVNLTEAAVRAHSDPFPPLIEGPASCYKFPLHGDGTIEERVQKHFDELGRVADAYADEGLSSRQHLSSADTVIFGAHSQGAPVAVMLLAKLLEAGVLSPGRQRITLFCAAGIFHGPFPHLSKNLVVQYVEAQAARQLFHLNDPESDVSRELLRCLDRVLQAGVNVSVVASWQDQVVPFYSACLLGIDHPNLWRGVHVRAPTDDFLTHLVQLGLKIANLRRGPEETPLILAQISDLLAGSIYRDAMHSAGYKHPSSYAAVLQWMFQGPGIRGIPVSVVDHIRARPLQSTSNPYYLPWLMRGWLRDADLVNHPLLREEFRLLHEKYEQWKPGSRALKDFKFQLEPIRLLQRTVNNKL